MMRMLHTMWSWPIPTPPSPPPHTTGHKDPCAKTQNLTYRAPNRRITAHTVLTYPSTNHDMVYLKTSSAPALVFVFKWSLWSSTVCEVGCNYHESNVHEATIKQGNTCSAATDSCTHTIIEQELFSKIATKPSERAAWQERAPVCSRFFRPTKSST